MSKMIGVDVGGTFTDVMFGDTESQQIAIHKVPTTPADPTISPTVRISIGGVVALAEKRRSPDRQTSGANSARLRSEITIRHCIAPMSPAARLISASVTAKAAIAAVMSRIARELAKT